MNKPTVEHLIVRRDGTPLISITIPAEPRDKKPGVRMGRAVVALVANSYRDFRDADLAGINLCDAQIPCVDFTGASLAFGVLENVNLSGANLEGASLWGAYLAGVDFSDANLFNARLDDASGTVNISGADVRNAEWSGADSGGYTSIKSHGKPRRGHVPCRAIAFEDQRPRLIVPNPRRRVLDDIEAESMRRSPLRQESPRQLLLKVAADLIEGIARIDDRQDWPRQEPNRTHHHHKESTS
ncbi:MAG: pentapeptide repeat-containing protein [Caenispirillum sp.]|nr:pentapeptide repeat-containing protein [Caenispirillum sp.]